MQLQSLCDVKTDEGIRERLGQLPPKLEELYRQHYEKLTKASAEADREVTTNTFSWLLCAQRRLASSELLAALLVRRQCSDQLTIDHVLEMCSNMVVFDSTLDTFRFAHLSVREFLEKRPEYDGAVTNSVAAARCLLELLNAVSDPAIGRSVPEVRQFSFGSTRSYGLSPYANLYWATHCQLAAHQRASGKLKDLFFYFLDNESDPRSALAIWSGSVQELLDYSVQWNTYRRLEDTKTQKGMALFIACCFDFPEIVKRQSILSTDVRNHNGFSALEVAARHGSCDALSILVDDKLSSIGDGVVEAAAENEERGKEVMQLLLEKRGAEVIVTKEVIRRAALNQKSGKEVTLLLLEQGPANMVLTEDIVRSIAANFDIEVMRVLLEQRGADVVVTEEVVKQQRGIAGRE